MYDLSSPGVVISDAVHRALNDLVQSFTAGRVSGWMDNYRISLGLDGDVIAQPVEAASAQGLQGFGTFFSARSGKLCFLPHSPWDENFEKGVYICFWYEYPVLMQRQAERLAKLQG